MADARRNVVRWLLIDGNRHVVATLFLAGTFLLLVVLARIGTIDVADQEAVRAIAGGFVPGLIAFLSIVLAINQLVLSQEFGSAGEIRERIRNVREYRHDVEEMAETGPSPVLPTGFLSFVVRTIGSEAAGLEASVGPETDPEVRRAIETYAGAVADEASRANESLEQVHPGRVNALISVLEYDDSAQLYEARRLRRDFEESLPGETRAALSNLIEALELFGVARTQFRTTYTQRVLARLSRELLYVGLPALVVVVVLGLLETPSPFVPGHLRPVVVSALFTVALSPLVVLASYLLRVAAVSERTIAAGPFVSRPNAAGTGRSPRPGGRPVDRDDAPTDADRESEGR